LAAALKLPFALPSQKREAAFAEGEANDAKRRRFPNTTA
jgi:hypothetical protein